MDAYSLQDRSNFHPSYPNLNFDTNKYKGDLDNVVINNQPLATVMIPNNYRIERQSLDTNNPHNLESNYQPPHPSTDNLAFDEKTIRAGFFRKVCQNGCNCVHTIYTDLHLGFRDIVMYAVSCGWLYWFVSIRVNNVTRFRDNYYKSLFVF